MPFCIKCGSKLPSEAAFCPNCGAPTTPSENKRIRKLEDAERANEPFWVSCELCHHPCKALGKPLGSDTIPVATPEVLRRMARYCKKCNIIVCGACAGVPLFVKGTMGLENRCPRCGEFMEYAAACHVRKTKAKLV